MGVCPNLENGDVEKIILAADANCDGRVSYEEFVNWIAGEDEEGTTKEDADKFSALFVGALAPAYMVQLRRAETKAAIEAAVASETKDVSQDKYTAADSIWSA